MPADSIETFHPALHTKKSFELDNIESRVIMKNKGDNIMILSLIVLVHLNVNSPFSFLDPFTYSITKPIALEIFLHHLKVGKLASLYSGY